MSREKRGPSGFGMVQVVAAALVLLLLLFLMPLLLIRGRSPAAEGAPEPTGGLPLDRTVVSPSPSPAPSGRDGDRTVKVKLDDGTVKAMTMADYLWSVVAAEMPASFELEALKAQAVAARTYAVAKMGGTVSTHPDADMCTDITCCQAYIEPATAVANWGGSGQTYEDKIREAVADTDGLVALYDGQPIQAVFFSSTAGRTVDAEEVWGNAVPYLKSVESPEGDEVPGYRSSVEITQEEFKKKVAEAYPDADLSGSADGWLTNVAPNSAGGVKTVDVGGVTIKGGAVRTLLGLRSASFTWTVEGERLVFSVVGYGHGVGLSQYGANALARQGKTCQEIVTWYYTGVTLEAWPE